MAIHCGNLCISGLLDAKFAHYFQVICQEESHLNFTYKQYPHAVNICYSTNLHDYNFPHSFMYTYPQQVPGNTLKRFVGETIFMESFSRM